jgi:hypothetical protein
MARLKQRLKIISNGYSTGTRVSLDGHEIWCAGVTFEIDATPGVAYVTVRMPVAECDLEVDADVTETAAQNEGRRARVRHYETDRGATGC